MEDEKETRESKVSKLLSDYTTKKVIIVVLVLLFLIPLFSVDYYLNPPTSMSMQAE
jgi:asparagine N-glycosylation enzyme membrane subunit Stt3